MLLWTWNNIQLSLPAEWEMLQFSRDPDRGRCAFADRYRYRFELNWSEVPGEPDFKRMMSDYAAKLESDGKMKDIQPIRIAGVQGLAGKADEGEISRFGVWMEPLKRLVECVFLWDEKRDSEFEKQVLGTLQPRIPSNGLTLWRAFGMELSVPEHLELESCTVQSASAGFLFRGKKPIETWIFRRFGMADQWLKTDLETWLKGQVPKDIRDLSVTNRSGSAAGTLVLAAGEYHPSGLIHKNGLFTAAAWQNPADKRLYLAMLTNPKTTEWFKNGKSPADYLKSAPEFTRVP